MPAPREPDLDTPAGVLERARELRTTADRAEADLLALAADWAVMHSVETVPDIDAAFGERDLPVAGPGAPGVAEFCVAEFALVIGKSTDAGRAYLGEAVEIRYRLPEVQARLDAGDLPAWRARRIAQSTICLPQEAAEARSVRVCLDGVGFEGVVNVNGVVDLPDAVDLEHALQAGAAQLAEQGSTDSLDVRRAKALGLLARGLLNLPQTRRISLHVHASADPSSPLVRVEETKSFVLIDRLAEWCTHPATQLDVRPVIDLADHIHVEAYEVPERLATQTGLRDLTCVFPGCARPARRCDCDHVIPESEDGPTCTCNIAPLCRGHHRLKTHGGWTYAVIEPGSYLWTSPHGYQYLRDHHGTLDVTPDHRGQRPEP